MSTRFVTDGSLKSSGGGGDIINVTASSVTLSSAKHAGKKTTVDTSAGCAITLPAATGTGDVYDIFITTTIGSNTSTIKVANATDTMVGELETATTTGATTNGFCEAAGGTDDTITLNGGTTGGVAGSRIKLIDIASTVWYVEGFLVGSGSLATSLSATVS